jgi:hypothetical protein
LDLKAGIVIVRNIELKAGDRKLALGDENICDDRCAKHYSISFQIEEICDIAMMALHVPSCCPDSTRYWRGGTKNLALERDTVDAETELLLKEKLSRIGKVDNGG